MWGHFCSRQGCSHVLTSSTSILPAKLFIFSFFFSSRKRFAGAQRAETTFFMMLQALKNVQLGNATIYQLASCPKSPSIPKNLHATELKTVDLVFNPWKGSWVALLVSFSCSAFYLASGEERRGEIILSNLGINPLMESEDSGGPSAPWNV